jgi:hypothetical protein
VEARRIATIALCALTGALVGAGCGGGERQDEDEPEGNFQVEVVSSSFPAKQRLAEKSDLEITLRNAGRRTIPNIAVTLTGFNYRKGDAGLADPSRPRFVVNGVERDIGGFPESQQAAPRGCETAYVNTWACGPLKPGRERTFRWSVTAVKAGDFRIDWRAAAGLDGKARAVAPEGGDPPRGTFTGNVSDAAPDTRIADDGKTVITGTR